MVAAEGRVTVAAEGRITVAAEGRVTVAAEGRITVAAEGRITVAAEGRITAAQLWHYALKSCPPSRQLLHTLGTPVEARRALPLPVPLNCPTNSSLRSHAGTGKRCCKSLLTEQGLPPATLDLYTSCPRLPWRPSLRLLSPGWRCPPRRPWRGLAVQSASGASACNSTTHRLRARESLGWG